MTDIRLVVPTRVTLDHWHHAVFGERWSLRYEDRALVTRGTELEARRCARELGWLVEAPDAVD